MSYPIKPTGDNILPFDTLFASNNSSKSAMTTGEILDGYNNDGETETDLTSRPDANKFNMFWYQVHSTVKWIVDYIEELYNDKLSKTGGIMSGLLNMGNNKITLTYTPSNNTDAVNKEYVDKAINGSMWLGEVKCLSYPTIPSLPADVVVVPCDGRAISRTTYAGYFAMVGTAFGAGNGSTTFNVPDYRGMFIRGWDGGTNRDKGRVFGTIQGSASPNITGTFFDSQENETGLPKNPTGCFYRQAQAGNGCDGTRGWFETLAFDASRSSSVYQNGVAECRPINGSGYYVVRIK